MDIGAFFKISYGLYVISAVFNGKKNGYIGNTVFQITAEPPRLAISCHRENYSEELIRQAGVFSISVLSQDAGADIIGRFGYKSGRDIDKFEGLEHISGVTGAPILIQDSIAYFECTVEQEVKVGTHTIFIAAINESTLLEEEGQALTYEHYRRVKQGLSPKNAPTYIDKSKIKKAEDSTGKRYKCNVCGYIYDPAEGDPPTGHAPGTKFEELPVDWTCPLCGVGKEDFNEL